MSFTRKSIADHLDSYDDEIAELQDGKRDTLNDYRHQLAEAGMTKPQIKSEIDALKIAMRRRRAIAKTSETEVEEADALADEIFVEITSSARRATRVASAVPDHDPITGEITDTQEQPETATRCNTPVSRAAGFDPAGGQHGEHGQDGSYCRDSVERHASIPQSAEVPPAADKPETAVTPLPAVSGAIPEGIPAFLLKERKPLRPNCLHPDNCAGYGTHTCHSCTRAMAESEAA